MSDHEQWGKGTQARIVADSQGPAARLTTFVLKYPRMVHAELMTHRMFSRNSSSSRAIPTKTLIQRVIDDPAGPCYWGANKRGMQAGGELEGEARAEAERLWYEGRFEAIKLAESLLAQGLHKQIANRVIEPWMYITVICTATNYANWFRLRDHPMAQPEIAQLARLMRAAYDASEPTSVEVGDWHTPFISDDAPELLGRSRVDMRKVSTARCARVSYLTHEGVRDIKKDIELHDRLKAGDPPHASAFEHCAQALATPEKVGNFVGWLQYRKLIAREAIH